ncbi:MAG: Hsp20/alpha crystallin family protein, partial [Pseudomonadota bacterium]
RSSWCTGSFAGLLMFLNQGLQNGTSHEQGVAAGVYIIVRDATRSFQLPADVDAAQAKAKYDNGVLTLTLPKKQSGATQRLKIE